PGEAETSADPRPGEAETRETRGGRDPRDRETARPRDQSFQQRATRDPGDPDPRCLDGTKAKRETPGSCGRCFACAQILTFPAYPRARESFPNPSVPKGNKPAMLVTIDKADVFRRLARVKGWSRNGDILELLDVLEHVLTVGYS